MYYEIPREEVVLDKRVNMARRLISIKVKRTSEALKQILRYRIVGDEKSSLTGKERLLQGG